MHNGKALKKADPSTIQDKLLVGYQGWFTCAGDGEPVGRGHHGWLHWFDYPVPDGGRPNTDIWPDVSEYDPSELHEAPGLRTRSGEKCYLFSSRNQKTVDRHFNWMAQHGVDGAFLQRFAGQCEARAGNDGIRRIRDEVGDRVQEAAEKNGRAYAIMYDVSGVPPDKIEEIIKFDWKHLVFNKRIFDSPSYLREKGKPVVALWGFGFEDSRHTPGLVRSIASYINNSNPGGVYLMAGVPAHWRTSTGDADRNPDFVEVWLDCFDAISPWTVGRYGNIADADRFAEKIAGDVKLINERNKTVRSRRRLDYIPVVLPGGSGYNLSEGKWNFNGIRREGGRFLWRQIYNARKNGVRTIYGAMWDEYDEGTAFMPIVTRKDKLPLPVRDKYRFLAPDADAYDLPSDWYMRICGLVAEVLRGDRRLLEAFPQKELQDYWRSRPRYEDGTCGGHGPANSSTPGASGSGLSHTSAAEENPNEPPPPPYTLEAESSSPNHDGFLTAPTSPDNQQNFNVSDLANDLGRHTLGGPSSLHANISTTTGAPLPAFANKPTSTQSTTPLTTPPPSSYLLPPFGPSQDVGMPSIPVPQVPHGTNPQGHSVNLNTPFHWNNDYPNPQSQPPGGYNAGAPANPWDPPATTKPQETPFQPGYKPGYAPPPPHPQHSRPPFNTATKPTLPSQFPNGGAAALNSSPSFKRPGSSPPSGCNPPYLPSPSTYPGQVGPGSYYGYDQKTDEKGSDVWGGPPPPKSSYPGSGYTQQSSYLGQTHGGPPPLSSSPPLPQGYGQQQSSYPGMTNSPPPGTDRPPPSYPVKSHTWPPVPNSPPLSQGPASGGYGQNQSSYPGMTSSPSPGPIEHPPTRPPTQSTYGGMNPSASTYQPTGPGPYGYQQPSKQQQSTYPGYNPIPSTSPYSGYPGSHPPPPLPHRRQDWSPSRPTSSGGPGGPGFNQAPHQHPYSPQQPQSYGGHTTGLSYSASTSSSYSNATASWKKQQTGVMGLAKDTVDKFAGRETRKNVQASVQSVLKPFMK